MQSHAETDPARLEASVIKKLRFSRKEEIENGHNAFTIKRQKVPLLATVFYMYGVVFHKVEDKKCIKV